MLDIFKGMLVSNDNDIVRQVRALFFSILFNVVDVFLVEAKGNEKAIKGVGVSERVEHLPDVEKVVTKHLDDVEQNDEVQDSVEREVPGTERAQLEDPRMV